MLGSKPVEKISDRGRASHVLDILTAACYNGCVVQRFLNEWGALPPKFRFFIRNATAVVGGAAVAAYLSGEVTDWNTLKGAVIAGALKFVVGIFTPEEPFVGFNKPDVVAVPSPPAADEDLVNP